MTIPQERFDEGEVVDSSWPAKPSIQLSDVKLRYRPDTDIVLKGLSFAVNPGERVGVVGRTGAGKSTLAMALTRIVEIESGSIQIGGDDISDIELASLRS